MVKVILVFSNHRKLGLCKFYQSCFEDPQQQIIRETVHLVSMRGENVCNFLEGGLLIGASDNKLIYRHYAILYFVSCVKSSESELGILDTIRAGLIGVPVRAESAVKNMNLLEISGNINIGHISIKVPNLLSFK
ncbi:AP-3 complex subunit sigma-1-like isoform X3 [Pteronotus mesoamericanus]|uniref:AP-3 complex subunit sigma-1-like isoform X3 n=1 Tax=Pteronotus mesoamericanus TaxID=1884717 RepID=UPI0023EB260A|nr:AP-3 complex subunit sigma-1-like isoform X3 [Pteronotus parnellii mesoamericanus]